VTTYNQCVSREREYLATVSTAMRHLSKSKLISGWQCPKRLWLEIHKPDAGEFSPQTEAAFAIGHEAGAAHSCESAAT